MQDAHRIELHHAFNEVNRKKALLKGVFVVHLNQRASVRQLEYCVDDIYLHSYGLMKLSVALALSFVTLSLILASGVAGCRTSPFSPDLLDDEEEDMLVVLLTLCSLPRLQTNTGGASPCSTT
jgi:hypothetical protein